MKHSYNATCECERCRREHGRRNSQAKETHARHGIYRAASRISRRERAYADWAMSDDGPGDYEIHGADPNA